MSYLTYETMIKNLKDTSHREHTLPNQLFQNLKPMYISRKFKNIERNHTVSALLNQLLQNLKSMCISRKFKNI